MNKKSVSISVFAIANPFHPRTKNKINT